MNNRLVVEINRANFEYDVNAIVKAFYPEALVGVMTPLLGADKREEWGKYVKLRIHISEEGAVLESWLGAETAACPSRETVPAGEEAPATGKKVPPAAGKEGFPGMAAPAVLEWHFDGSAGEGMFKNEFKRFLYKSLEGITGRKLPWGALTGIRPTKIAYRLLEDGWTEEEIRQSYRKNYFTSEEKIGLSLEIAERERQILAQAPFATGYSLYIGIPFCPTTCLYCSFTSYPIAAWKKRVEEYIDCLIREMEFVSAQYRNRRLDSIYIGGGTPTTLEPEQLERLLSALQRLFDFSEVKEFTVEAGRADSITREKLMVLRRFGVTRISINPQTMKQETLDLIGRRHTVEQVEEAFGLARELGFDNINMDLILGLPGEEAEDVQRTIDRIRILSPDSLTVHSLAIKRASRLNEWIREHGVPTLKNTDETMAIAARGAADLGMHPYYLYRQKNMSGNFENVGYARPGKYGLYNILIMEEVQTIIALGAGSISKKVSSRQSGSGSENVLIKRCENVKEVALYIEKIDEMIERKRRLLTDAE